MKTIIKLVLLLIIMSSLTKCAVQVYDQEKAHIALNNRDFDTAIEEFSKGINIGSDFFKCISYTNRATSYIGRFNVNQIITDIDLSIADLDQALHIANRGNVPSLFIGSIHYK